MTMRVVTYCPNGGMVNQFEQLLSAAYACRQLNASLVLPPFICDHIRGPDNASVVSSWTQKCFSMLSSIQSIDISSVLDISSVYHIIPQVLFSLPKLPNATVVTAMDQYFEGLRGSQRKGNWKQLTKQALLPSRARLIHFKFGNTFHMFKSFEKKGLKQMRMSHLIVDAADEVLKDLPNSFDCAHIRTGSPSSWDGVALDITNMQYKRHPHFMSYLKETLQAFKVWAERFSTATLLVVSTDSKTLCEEEGVSRFGNVLYMEDILRSRQRFSRYTTCDKGLEAALSAYVCSRAVNFFGTRGSHFSLLIKALRDKR